MTVQTPNLIPLPHRTPEEVMFDRQELGAILTLYGRMVAAGEWRDYGISRLREVAVFSVFRRATENPLYRIEKRPKCGPSRGSMPSSGQRVRSSNAVTTCLPSCACWSAS